MGNLNQTQRDDFDRLIAGAISDAGDAGIRLDDIIHETRVRWRGPRSGSGYRKMVTTSLQRLRRSGKIILTPGVRWCAASSSVFAEHGDALVGA